MLDEYGDDYLQNPEVYEYDSEDCHEFSNDEINHIYESVGGQEQYQELLQFAAENLPEEFIDQYNALY